MNCLDCQQLLQQFLDGDVLPDQAEYGRHLTACTECRDRHAAAHRLVQALRRQAVPVVPPALTEAIVGRILVEQRLVVFRRRVLTGAAMAAGILLALFLSYYPFQKVENGVGPVAVVAPPVAPPPSVNQTVGEAGQALAALLNRTTEETLGQGKLLLPDMGQTPPLADARVIEAAWTPTAQSLEEAGRGVSSGLEPVTTSARRAFNLFLKEIPSLEKDAKPGL